MPETACATRCKSGSAAQAASERNGVTPTTASQVANERVWRRSGVGNSATGEAVRENPGQVNTRSTGGVVVGRQAGHISGPLGGVTRPSPVSGGGARRCFIENTGTRRSTTRAVRGAVDVVAIPVTSRWTSGRHSVPVRSACR